MKFPIRVFDIHRENYVKDILISCGCELLSTNMHCSCKYGCDGVKYLGKV